MEMSFIQVRRIIYFHTKSNTLYLVFKVIATTLTRLILDVKFFHKTNTDSVSWLKTAGRHTYEEKNATLPTF